MKALANLSVRLKGRSGVKLWVSLSVLTPLSAELVLENCQAVVAVANWFTRWFHGVESVRIRIARELLRRSVILLIFSSRSLFLPLPIQKLEILLIRLLPGSLLTRELLRVRLRLLLVALCACRVVGMAVSIASFLVNGLSQAGALILLLSLLVKVYFCLDLSQELESFVHLLLFKTGSCGECQVSGQLELVERLRQRRRPGVCLWLLPWILLVVRCTCRDAVGSLLELCIHLPEHHFPSSSWICLANGLAQILLATITWLRVLGRSFLLLGVLYKSLHLLVGLIFS